MSEELSKARRLNKALCKVVTVLRQRLKEKVPKPSDQSVTIYDDASPAVISFLFGQPYPSSP